MPEHEHHLAAILSADAVGYSRLMASDEEATIHTLNDHRGVIRAVARRHHGRVVGVPGDNVLVEFPAAVDAVGAAVEIQQALAERNGALQEDRRMPFRIGVHLGDVAVAGEEVFGSGVNIAARLEGLAKPGGICISAAVLEQVQGKLSLRCSDIGAQRLKNIPHPVHAYHVDGEPAPPLPRPEAGRRPRRPFLALAGTAALAVLAALFLLPWQGGAPAPVDKPSIAVLPFVNMSGDPEQEYFADGIAEDLITDLAKIPALLVVSRSSSFTYKGRKVRPRDVGQDLGVRYLVEGSVRKVRGRVRITAQLVDTATDHHLWAERYDGSIDDVFALQDKVRERIVQSLRVEVTETEAWRVRRTPARNIEAYDHFLRGLAFMRSGTAEAIQQAHGMFERAVELDPDFAPAYGALARAELDRELYPSRPEPAVIERGMADRGVERAFDVARRGRSLDDSVPAFHSALAWRHVLQGRHADAVAEAQRSLALNPNDPWAFLDLGAILNLAGRPAEAIPVLKAGLRRDPHGAFRFHAVLGEAYRQSGKTEEALAALAASRSEEPGFLVTHLLLARLHADLGEEDSARRDADAVRRLSPGYSPARSAWLAYADPAERERALAALRRAGLG